MTFPVLTVAFTAFSLALSDSYMSSADHRGTLIVRDLSEDGDVLRENQPQSDIYLGELLMGVDKKRRYFKPIRVEMFSKMHEWIRSYSKDVCVYLCMESQEIWQKSFGWSPRNSGELRRLLDEQVGATPSRG